MTLNVYLQFLHKHTRYQWVILQLSLSLSLSFGDISISIESRSRFETFDLQMRQCFDRYGN